MQAQATFYISAHLFHRVGRKCSFKIYAVADDDSTNKITIIKAIDGKGINLHISGNRITRFDLLSQNENKIFVQIKTVTKIALKTTAYEL